MPTNKVCVECPFRKDSTPGHLGGYTPDMYVEALRSPASIACHMSPGFYAGDHSTQHHCTGLAIMRDKSNYPTVPLVNGAQTAVIYTRARAAQEQRDVVFDTLLDFHKHHSEGQE